MNRIQSSYKTGVFLVKGPDQKVIVAHLRRLRGLPRDMRAGYIAALALQLQETCDGSILEELDCYTWEDFLWKFANDMPPAVVEG